MHKIMINASMLMVGYVLDLWRDFVAQVTRPR